MWASLCLAWAFGGPLVLALARVGLGSLLCRLLVARGGARGFAGSLGAKIAPRGGAGVP